MGGRTAADVDSNCGAGCRDHARISDGEYGAGGREQYRQAHLDLFTVAPGPYPFDGLGWVSADRQFTVQSYAGALAYDRAEALTAIVING